MTGLVSSTDGGVVTLTLDRPEARNALTPALIAELTRVIESVGADPAARMVVVRGAGQAFCAGYDVNHLTSPGTPEAGREPDEVELLCSRLQELRMPTLAVVAGVASGAGCDLAVSCDLRIASEAAQFAMPPARLGILYGTEGVRRLTALVGPSVAKELLFTGDPVDAGRALAIGLVNRVVAPERLEGEVSALVARVLANAPLSVEGSKLIVDGAPASVIEDAHRRIWYSEDAQEGPRAFRERRPPRFLGR